MTVSGLPEPPGPPDPRRLSSREEAILARIENDLVEDDPTLAHDLAGRHSLLRSPISIRSAGALVAILSTLVASAVLLPSAAWWPVLPLLTVALLAPWTVLCVRRSDPDH